TPTRASGAFTLKSFPIAGKSTASAPGPDTAPIPDPVVFASSSGRSIKLAILRSRFKASCQVADHLRQNSVRRPAFGMGVEVRDDTVAQDRMRNKLYVSDADVQAAAHHRPYPRTFYQRLRAARRAAVADPSPGLFVRALATWLRRDNQVDGEVPHAQRHLQLPAN